MIYPLSDVQLAPDFFYLTSLCLAQSILPFNAQVEASTAASRAPGVLVEGFGGFR